LLLAAVAGEQRERERERGGSGHRVRVHGQVSWFVP
jgi:hypothetical protein